MTEKCIFCKEHIESPFTPRLEENKMFMFEILMEQTSFDKEFFTSSPMCEDCDKTILNFFKFKSNFMESEDEFINYMDSDNKVDLYDILVKTYKVKRFANETVPIKVCRICFKATQVEDYKEIKSLESIMATMVKTCLPEFNLKLTDNTYLCHKCHSILLQYYHFLLLCSTVNKSRKRASSSNLSELVEDKKQKLTEDVLVAKSVSEPSLPPAVLVPVVPQRRGPGRPRKDKGLSNLVLPPKKSKKQKPSAKTKDEQCSPNKNEPAIASKISKTDLKDADAASYNCQICPEIFQNLQSLKKHITGHEQETHFFCWKCGYTCYNFGALCRHYDGHGLALFTIVKSKENETTKKDSSEFVIKTKNVQSTTDDATGSDKLLAVKRTDVYTPPDLKKKRGRKRKNPLPADTSTPNSTATSGKSTSKELYKVIKVIANQTSDKEKEALTSSEKTRRITRLPSPTRVSASTIPCPTCKRTFNGLDGYMNHSCSFKVKSTCDREENAIEQEFGCGHCSAVFYSLDDLDEHNCISSSAGGDARSGGGPLNTSRKSDSKQVNLAVSGSRTATADIESLSKNTEADYQCSYCLLTFNTITGLDKHVCEEDPENTTSLETSNVLEVKKENLFECTYCVSLFETALELIQHKCSSAPAHTPAEEVSIGTDEAPATDGLSQLIKPDPECSPGSGRDVSDSTEAVPATDGIGRLIKTDPEYDSFMSPDSDIELERETCSDIQENKDCNDVQQDKNVADDGMGTKSTDDVRRSKDVVNQDKSGNAKEMTKSDKKKLINKIANMLGVKIVEGGDGSNEKNGKSDHNCIGCDFRAPSHKDLMFHFGFCDKVIRCNYCSYGTNISQKLEIHTWAVHNILVFVCSWCNFVTSMQENYETHLSTHKEYFIETIDDDSQNTTLNEVQFISANRGLRADFESNLRGNYVTNGTSAAMNPLFEFGNCRNGNGNQTDLVEHTINGQQRASSSTDSCQENDSTNPDSTVEGMFNVDQIWPADSDDDLEDSVAFQIPSLQSEDPLATEPVWLVSSSSIDDNLAQPRLTDETPAPEENSADPDQTELIIPDRIIPEPTDVKLEPSREPAKASDNDRETIYIRDDSDSDSEFVESSETRISKVAARAEEVRTVSASEASKLISEGVPVVSESNLVTVQVESSPIVTQAVTGNTATVCASEDQSSTHLQSDVVITQQNSKDVHSDSVNKTSENSLTKATDADKESTESRNEKEPKSNSANANNLRPESTKQSPGQIEDSLIISNAEKEPVKGDTGKPNKEEEASKENSRKDSNEAAAAAKKGFNTDSGKAIEEEGAQSDASSYFVTDNEDSDRDDEETQTRSTKPVAFSTKPQASLNQKGSAKKIVEKPFLPADINDGGFISDDEDNDIGKDGPLQNLTSTNARRNTKDCVGQATKNRLTKSAILSSKSTSNANKIVSATIPKKVLSKLPNVSTVGAEDSVVISDDEDGSAASTKTSKLGPGRRLNVNLGDIVNSSCTRKSPLITPKKANEKPVFSVKKTKFASFSCKGSGRGSEKPAPATCSSKSTKNALLTKEAAKLSVAAVSKSPCVVIDDDDDVVAADGDKTKEPRSRNDSSSSSLVLERDFSKETDGESSQAADKDSGDDCVFVSEVDGIRQSKNFGTSDTNVKKDKSPVKAPPNAFNLFISKVKSEIKVKYPDLKWSAQKDIIVDAWKSMSTEDKWPFREEARLHRLLYRREHPELIPQKRKVKKSLPVPQPALVVSEDKEEIVLD